MTWLVVLLAAAAAALGAYGWSARRHAADEVARVNLELSRRLHELFSLQELSYLLSESLQLDRIVDQVARYLMRFLGAQGAMVVLAGEREGDLHVAAAEGSLLPLAGRVVPEAEAALVGAAMAGEKLELAQGPKTTTVLPGVEARRVAVAPLRAHEMTAGAIVAVDPPQDFGADQLRLLSTVATHAAVVLTNARFFDQLRAGKEQWESTFDALADGVAVVDAQGRVKRANQALAQLLKQPIAEVIGRDLAHELFGRSVELARLYDPVRRGDRVAPVTQRSDRLRRVLRISASRMLGEASAGWVVTLIEDVTEQQAFEAQMIQHEKMAAVGQLVSGVAHELNNPLTSIAGLAELLFEQHSLDPRTKQHAHIIHEQAQRAGKIVRNLLTFARQGPADVVSLDLNDIVHRTAQLIEYEVRLRQIQLVTELTAEPAVVRGDRLQLQQVLVNLLTNALHAVGGNPPDRPRRVTVRTGHREDRVTMEVEDTGPGVPDDLVRQIFTPFFTTKEPGEGTGLGLAISYSIVERSGGTLEVHRATHGGALFRAELPSAPAVSGEHRAERTSGGYPVTSGPAVGPSYQVLLVDGDPAVQRMITVLFSDDGHAVEAAQDPAHAVELLERRSWDLVIADPRAAVSAGEPFAEVLLARWPGLKARTIFATADVRPETEDWLKRLGCRYFLKPVNARQLRAAAAALLRP